MFIQICKSFHRGRRSSSTPRWRRSFTPSPMSGRSKGSAERPSKGHRRRENASRGQTDRRVVFSKPSAWRGTLHKFCKYIHYRADVGAVSLTFFSFFFNMLYIFQQIIVMFYFVRSCCIVYCLYFNNKFSTKWAFFYCTATKHSVKQNKTGAWI